MCRLFKQVAFGWCWLMLLVGCDDLAGGGAGGPSGASEQVVRPGDVVGLGGQRAPGVTADKRLRYCEPIGRSALRSPWYAFADADRREFDEDCKPGLSTASLFIGDELPSDGVCPTGVEGVLRSEGDAAYAGMGIGIQPDSEIGTTGVWIETRGDGATYRLEFVDVFQASRLTGGCSDEHSNHPGVLLRCGDGGAGWTRELIRFDDLQQREGWGVSHRLEPRDLRRMAVVRERPASPAAVLDDSDSVVGRFEQTFRCEFAIIRWAKPEDVIELGGVPLDDELAVDETGGSPEAEPPLGVPPDP